MFSIILHAHRGRVSTHSRAKAAANGFFIYATDKVRFNTQPREGGCSLFQAISDDIARFQHTAARRRLLVLPKLLGAFKTVSTHSRAKAAARVRAFGWCNL